MRISDWSSDVCSSDLSATCVSDSSASSRCSTVSSSWPSMRAETNAASRAFCNSSLSISGLRARTRLCIRDRSHSAQRQLHVHPRSEEHTSELQSLMRISYAVFCLKKKKKNKYKHNNITHI